MGYKTALVATSAFVISLVMYFALGLNNGATKQAPPTEVAITSPPLNQQSSQQTTALSASPLTENTFTSVQTSSQNDALKPKMHDMLSIEEAQATQFPFESFDELLKDESGQLYMDSAPIEQMNLEQLSWYLAGLPKTMTQARTQDVLEGLNHEVAKLTDDSDVVFIHDLQCSDKLCGLIFESTKESEVNTALTHITSSATFKNTTRGGTLRIMEENGIFYGVVVASISEQPITLR